MSGLGLALSLAAVVATAAAEVSAIDKSPIDSKEYRALVLENGLKVLLVSDRESDKSAASLDVHVGSGSDPVGWQGLAHFLEHMLFLGTEKYPEAGEYKRFIEDHGGDSNAYTSFAHTNYYFDISAAHLRPALARFSRFFIDPTFDETFVARERAVVHSEYQARYRDESRRLWAARRQLINPDHPGSRFSVGSEHTLRDRDSVGVRQKLLEFHERHYSADIMTLAVVGREPLDQLEGWVTELFAAIPDRDAQAERYRQPYMNPQLPPSRLDVVPQQDRLQVGFLFPLPTTEPHYRTKPLGYIANLLGHEGEGSLLALLRSRGWAEGLVAGVGYMDAVQGVFDVSIQLTESGLRHIDEIGALLFQYIDLVRGEGVEFWRYDEARQLAEISFRFAEEPGAAATARRLAASLHRYPSEAVLSGPYMMEDYRPDLIHDVLDRLRPDNVWLQVVSRDAETTGRTPFYAVDFAVSPIAQSTIDLWRGGERGERGERSERLALPAANPFIPERLIAHPPGEASPIPRRLETVAGVNAWHHRDAQFGTPRAAFYFSVKSPRAGGSARNLVLTELFVRLVNQQLETVAYPAYLAGLRHQLYRHSRGFSVRISGYADKQPALLEALLAALLAPSFDAQQLALAKAELARQWHNVSLQSPSRQSVRELYRLLVHPHWSEPQRLAVLDEIEVGHLRAHAARLLEKVSLTTLSHGDVSQSRAIAMNQMLAAAFADSDMTAEVAPPRTRMLDDHTAHLRSLDVEHGDSALLAYFQGGGKSELERAKMALLARLMESPFFFRLRTTERVGYLVHVVSWEILQVPGLLFSVQSPTHGPARIEQLIDEFLGEFRQSLEQMDDLDFAQVKQGLMDRILTRDQRLTDRTNRYWREIDVREFGFDSRQRLVASLDGIGRKDILDYFQQLTEEHPRKLLVQSPGRRPQAADGRIDDERYVAVDNIAAFRQNARSFFPPYR